MKTTRAIEEALEAARSEGRVVEGSAVVSVPTPPCPVSVDSGPLSEKEFMWRVIHLAEAHGWKVYHTYDSRKSAAGFPDLVLVRGNVLYVELKTDKGQPTKDQRDWMETLQIAGSEVHLWRPRNWDTIQRRLS